MDNKARCPKENKTTHFALKVCRFILYSIYNYVVYHMTRRFSNIKSLFSKTVLFFRSSASVLFVAFNNMILSSSKAESREQFPPKHIEMICKFSEK